jgi:hypothetical protein
MSTQLGLAVLGLVLVCMLHVLWSPGAPGFKIAPLVHGQFR